jgi:phosphoglycolate phosphatase
MKKRKFKAVLFDLDGTLVDTFTDIARAVNAVLKTHGYPVHEEETYKQMVGEGMERLVERALPVDARTPAVIERCLQSVKQEYARRWTNHTRPYQGIPQLLTTLEEMHVPLAILSNKPHEFTILTVRRFLSQWRFDMIVGARDGQPKKPDPAMAIDIADRLHIPPAEVLFLGDTGIDMQTAVAAGMFPVGALWGFRDTEELLTNGAVALVKTPLDVLEYF